MFDLIPKYYFLTSGIGFGELPVISFEMALREAGIAPFNLITVSSIIPKNCKPITADKGKEMLKGREGSLLFLVLARKTSNKESEFISAAVACARPIKGNGYGYICEITQSGRTPSETAGIAERTAMKLLETLYGDTEDKIRPENMIVDSVFTGTRVKKGLYTTALAAAVFIL